jgi:hypothetical protein
MTDPAGAYVRGLPEASGTFTGVYDPDIISSPTGDLIPFEFDTGARFNPAAIPMTAFIIEMGDQRWELPVDHVDLMGSNRVRIWVRRPEQALP